MAIFDSVKNGFITAVDTVSAAAQTVIEKNRVNAQLNRLRAVMRSECEMINRAYITLGKKYYENKKNNRSDSCLNEEELFRIIEQSKEKIRKTRERYREIIDSQTVKAVGEFNANELEDITVACSNEDEYGEYPFASVSHEDNPVADIPVGEEPEIEAPEAEDSDDSDDPFKIDLTPKTGSEEVDEDDSF